jgi:spore coat protein A, manganese oxidase
VLQLFGELADDAVSKNFLHLLSFSLSAPFGFRYHDHTLGITAPNVYTGLAGFYILRDEIDTGKPDNPLKLPTYPYEAAFVVADRMFKENGELFYPAWKGEPYYEGFITEENATFPSNRPTKLAEFFGDVITTNGIVWPKFKVEPRKYRLRLLNGCDSRYLILQFLAVPLGATTLDDKEPIPISFTLIGVDDGLATEARTVDTTLFEPSARQDIVFDFQPYEGYRIILTNLAGDEPFGGEPTPFLYNRTDRVMAFDVALDLNASVPNDFDGSAIAFSQSYVYDSVTPTRVRKLALFEGRDQYNRLQPLLGTVEPGR